MDVDIALFASLSDLHMPGVPGGRTRTYSLADGTTIADVIGMLDLPDQPRIIFVDGRHAEESAELLDGQRLAIFPPVAGG
ncbi:MAG: MoaD/ThiS family protein [Actinomycetota bacterium]|nr:MoaD/ThiS family protein [Actinomycetota bacterium]MDZ4178880.1 MoaD/ThiS family protein [Coriobacteriia bacterium]